MVRLLVGAVVGMVLLWPAGAEALKAPLAAQVRLHRFNSCPALVSYAQGHLKVTHGYPEPPIVALAGAPATARGTAKGVVGTAAPAASAATAGGAGTSASPSYSTTNNQETGVDEPDIAKTDGSTIFAIAQGRAPGDRSRRREPEARRDRSTSAGGGYGAQLLLRGNRVIVISGQTRVPVAAGADGRGRAGVDPVVAVLRRRVDHHPHRGRRQRPVEHEGDADDDRRRPVRRRPPGRHERADRDLVGAVGDPAAPARRRVEGLGADLAVPGRPHRTPLHAARRELRLDPPPGRLLRARDALDRHA